MTNSIHPPVSYWLHVCPNSLAHAPRSIGASGSVQSTHRLWPTSISRMVRFAMASGRGQAKPRASTVFAIKAMPFSDNRFAAVMQTAICQRLYSGLSVLVAAASDGGDCLGLLTFDALALWLTEDIEHQLKAQRSFCVFSQSGAQTFVRSFVQLRQLALELDSLRLYACSASVQTMDLDTDKLDTRLNGIMSTPRFLAESAGYNVLFV
jgi:peroxiredoxin family protein